VPAASVRELPSAELDGLWDKCVTSPLRRSCELTSVG
jgi:hypothetical protein